MRSGGASVPLSKGLNFTGGLAAAVNQATKFIDVTAAPTDANATALAPLLRGVGLTVDSSGNLSPRMRPRRTPLQDAFLSGNLVSGSIGSLGWNLLGTGTPAVTRVGANLAVTSKLLLSTSNVANNRSSLTLGNAENIAVAMASEVDRLQTAWNMNGDLTTKRVFFGMMGDFAQEPSAATSALGIYLDTGLGDTVYRAIARSGGVGTPVNTGASVPSNTSELISIRVTTPGTFQFRIGDTTIATISTNIPAVSMNIGYRVETLGASVETVRLGQFLFEPVDIGGCYDDDAFFEA